jgi:carotenoid cleavage dioxygenase-like enzyme
MTATQSNFQSTTRSAAWSKAIAQPAQEFPLTPLPILEGALPAELSGTLYRNGPGRLERGGAKVGHWFDGDGAVLAVHLNSTGATATYRFVKTAGYLAEEQADRLLYGGYGMTTPGPLWNRWGKPVKNAANTSVLALPDKVLALWEGGNPHALDRQTLETLGCDDLNGALADNLPYSAHPKRDPKTGEIFNFGLTPGMNTTLNLYRSDAQGTIRQKAAVTLTGCPLVHDFVLAGRYLVVIAPPVQINLFPVAVGIQSFSDAMSWQPNQGTEIVVIDRETLSVVSRGQTDPWFQWHFANGYEDQDGNLVVDLARYPDFSINQYLKEVATGETHTFAKAELWRIRIHPQTATVMAQERLVSRGCEFPVVKPHRVGQTTNDIYLSIHRSGADLTKELFGAIAHFNPQTETSTLADMGPNRYPSEPIYAPHPTNPEQGWILTVVFDGNTDSSELWIFDGDRLDDAPVCRLGLPSIIPPGFHGTWSAA